MLWAMMGPNIIARSLTAQRIPDKFDNIWQYHPQSDRHSKIGCWAVLFDLVQRCPLLKQHIVAGKVGFGINHTMVDFTSDRQKNLDLVISIPREEGTHADMHTFAGLADQYEVVLEEAERAVLAELPVLRRRPVGDVLLALEAKAAMGAHVRAGPRLYDELTSAWQCINGSAPHAIAIGFGMVNSSAEFISPKMNKFNIAEREPIVGYESQPNGVTHIQKRFRSLRVRGHVTERGYDAVGLLTIKARNDGSPITLTPSPPALPPGDSLHYERMILRVAGLYDSRFLSR
jgi:hypothetical protein